MEQHHMLPEDEALRMTDVPERLQLARGRDIMVLDVNAAAEWVIVPILRMPGLILPASTLEANFNSMGVNFAWDCK